MGDPFLYVIARAKPVAIRTPVHVGLDAHIEAGTDSRGRCCDAGRGMTGFRLNAI